MSKSSDGRLDDRTLTSFRVVGGLAQFIGTPTLSTGVTEQTVLGGTARADLDNYGSSSPMADPGVNFLVGWENRKDQLFTQADRTAQSGQLVGGCPIPPDATDQRGKAAGRSVSCEEVMVRDGVVYCPERSESGFFALEKLFRLQATFACSLLCAAAFAQSETEFSTLEERMTGSEFTQAGLHKLRPEELAALNTWIRQRSLAEYDRQSDDSQSRSLPSAPAERAPGIDNMAREAFQSRILGTFSGSDGNARFRLENGMVWEQTDGRAFLVPEVENPPVTIKPGALGSWRLTVEGYNRPVRVKRIR